MEKENKNFSGDTKPQEEIKVESADLTGLIMDQAFQDEANRIVNNTKVVDIESESKELEARKDVYGKESLSEQESKTLNINDVRKGKFKDFFKKAISIDISKDVKNIDITSANESIDPDTRGDDDE